MPIGALAKARWNTSSASRSALSVSRRSLMSRRKPTNAGSPPCSSRASESSTGTSAPSRRSASSSTARPIRRLSPVRTARSTPALCAGRIAGGTMSSPSSLPIASSALQPSIASARAFQRSTRPSAPMTTTASGAPLINAASPWSAGSTGEASAGGSPGVELNSQHLLFPATPNGAGFKHRSRTSATDDLQARVRRARACRTVLRSGKFGSAHALQAAESQRWLAVATAERARPRPSRPRVAATRGQSRHRRRDPPRATAAVPAVAAPAAPAARAELRVPRRGNRPPQERRAGRARARPRSCGSRCCSTSSSASAC